MFQNIDWAKLSVIMPVVLAIPNLSIAFGNWMRTGKPPYKDNFARWGAFFASIAVMVAIFVPNKPISITHYLAYGDSAKYAGVTKYDIRNGTIEFQYNGKEYLFSNFAVE